MILTKQAIEENHARFLERMALHKRFGFDVHAGITWMLSRILPLQEPVLEIGTGSGRFLTALAGELTYVTTVDISPEEQQIARLNVAYEQLSSKVRFVIADATALPWQAGQFKTAVSMIAMHHIEKPLRAVAEMERVVGPEGKIVVADFDESGFEIMDRIHASEGRVHPRSAFTFREFEQYLSERGWSVSLSKGSNLELLIATAKGHD